jgi:hypothetical protein
VLAKFDPDGRPTTGIEVVTNDAYFADPGSGPSPMKTALGWDTTRYVNIYTNDAAGYLGYATVPQTHAGTVQDGVVLLWEAVGRNSLGGPPYNLGRTATHEIGHYLGLFHTFQDQCGFATQPYTSGDLIGDTTPERQPSYGCTPSESSCQDSGMNPIENYMNYSNDECMNRFTADQANRMRCAIMNFRRVNTAPSAQFTYTASGENVTFTNTSTDAESPLTMLKSKWTFGDGMTSTDVSPTHAYAAEGTYQVTLEVVDPGSGIATTTQSVAVVIAPSPPDAGDPNDDVGGPNDDDGGGSGSGDDGGGSGSGDDSGGISGGGGGCCQAPGANITFLLSGLPVMLVLLRRPRVCASIRRRLHRHRSER